MAKILTGELTAEAREKVVLFVNRLAGYPTSAEQTLWAIKGALWHDAYTELEYHWLLFVIDQHIHLFPFTSEEFAEVGKQDIAVMTRLVARSDNTDGGG